MLSADSSADEKIEIDRVKPMLPRNPHFDAKVKNVIFLHMAGSPPHLDLFDYKPDLVKRNDEPCPDEFYKGKQFAFTNGRPKLLGTPHKFKQHGENGTWFSDAIPQLAGIADDLCVVKSMHTDQFNHAPAQLMLYTGSPRMGRPSVGSWVTYGLGTENQDLPGFRCSSLRRKQPECWQHSLGQWIPAICFSRRSVSQQGRPGTLCVQSQRNGSRSQAYQPGRDQRT